MENKNKPDKSGIVIFVVVIVVSFIIFGACGGLDSNSGTKWSSLSEQEKENARWAYNVKQSLDNW